MPFIRRIVSDYTAGRMIWFTWAIAAAAAEKEEAASLAYLLLWSIGLLLSVLVIAVVLLSLRRHRRAPRSVSSAETLPDPWEESARRMEVDDDPVD